MKAPGGTTVDELWASLCAGRSTAAPYHDERWGPAPRLLACSVEGFDPAAYVTPAEVRRMDRSHLLAIGAAQDAMDGVVRRAARRRRSAARSCAAWATASRRSSSSR